MYYSRPEQYKQLGGLFYPSETPLEAFKTYSNSIAQVRDKNPIDFFQRLAKKAIKLGMCEEWFLNHIQKNYKTPYNKEFNKPYGDLSNYGVLNKSLRECSLLSLKGVKHKVYTYDKYVSDSSDFEPVVKDLVQFGKKSIISSVEASGKSTAFRNVVLPVMETKAKASETAIMYLAPLTSIVRQQYEPLKDFGFEMCVGSDERKGIIKDNECKNANTIDLSSRRVITTFKQAGILFNRYIEKGIIPIVYVDEIHAVIDTISYQYDNHHFQDIFNHEQAVVLGVSATPQYYMFQRYCNIENIVVMSRKKVKEEDKFDLSFTISQDKKTSSFQAFRKVIDTAKAGRRVLSINSNRTENEGFANQANELGIPADHCNSDRKNIDDFHSIRKTGRLQNQVLFSTTVIKEGSDVYGIDTVVNMNDTTGLDYTMARQSLRRGRDAQNMHLFTHKGYSTESKKMIPYDWVDSKQGEVEQRVNQINEALEAIAKVEYAKEFRSHILKTAFHEMLKGVSDQYNRYIRNIKGRAEVNTIAILCDANEKYKATLGHEDMLNIFYNDESFNLIEYNNAQDQTETFDNEELEMSIDERKDATEEIFSKTYDVEGRKIKGYDVMAAIIYFESNKENLRKELAYRMDYVAEMEARGYNTMPEELWKTADEIKNTYLNSHAIKLVKRYCRVMAATANSASQDFCNELVMAETDNEFSTHIKRLTHIRGQKINEISGGNKLFITAMTFGTDYRKIKFDNKLCKEVESIFWKNKNNEKHTTMHDLYKVYESVAKDMKYKPFSTENLTTKVQQATKMALYIKPMFDTKIHKCRVSEGGGGLPHDEASTIVKNSITGQQKSSVVKTISYLKRASYEGEYKKVLVDIDKKMKFHFDEFSRLKSNYLKKKEAVALANQFESLFN